MHHRFLYAVLAIAPLLAARAAFAAEDPNLLGSFRDWQVYAAGTGPERTCFAVSPPKEMTPTKLYARENGGLSFELPGKLESGAESMMAMPEEMFAAA